MNTKHFVESIITIGIGIYLFLVLVGKIEHKDPKKAERRDKIMNSKHGPWLYFFSGSIIVFCGFIMMLLSFLSD